MKKKKKKKIDENPIPSIAIILSKFTSCMIQNLTSGMWIMIIDKHLAKFTTLNQSNFE